MLIIIIVFIINSSSIFIDMIIIIIIIIIIYNVITFFLDSALLKKIAYSNSIQNSMEFIVRYVETKNPYWEFTVFVRFE